MPEDYFNLLRCPYEQDCSSSVIQEALRDPRIPPALNFLLLWLVREALYLTVSKKFENGRFSTTYHPEEGFDSLLIGKKKGFEAQQASIIKTVGKVSQILVEQLEKLDQGACSQSDVSSAFPCWLDFTDLLKPIFEDNILYVYRLRTAITEVFELFLNPGGNSRKCSVADFMNASAEQVLFHPVYTFKLRVLYYIASCKLQKAEAELIQRDNFYDQLYLELAKVKLEAINAVKDFASLSHMVQGMIDIFNGIRDGADAGNGAAHEPSGEASTAAAVGSAVARMFGAAASAVKYAVGVNPRGNFGVMLSCLAAELQSHVVQKKFEESFGQQASVSMAAVA